MTYVSSNLFVGIVVTANLLHWKAGSIHFESVHHSPEATASALMEKIKKNVIAIIVSKKRCKECVVYVNSTFNIVGCGVD